MTVRLIAIFVVILGFSAEILAEAPANVQLKPGRNMHQFPFFQKVPIFMFTSWTYKSVRPFKLIKIVEASIFVWKTF